MLDRPQTLCLQSDTPSAHALLRRLRKVALWLRRHRRSLPRQRNLLRSKGSIAISHIHLQRRKERLLRDVDLAVLAHLLLAFLLLLQKLSLARDIADLGWPIQGREACVTIEHHRTVDRKIRKLVMDKRWRVWVFSAVLGTTPTSSVTADVWVHEKTERSLAVAISSTITDQDAKTFENAIRNLEHRHLSVWLNSPGGDVFSAMNIGGLIRKHEGTTVISVPSKCYSSCALIFIAGVMRHNLGELGLHRPYFASAPQDRQTIERQLPRMLAMVKQYVAEMRITENFYELIVNTEPSKMTIYRIDDYAKLVPEKDAVFQEIQIAYDARRYGLTTFEMRQRDLDAEGCWKIGRATAEVTTCQEAIRWGLSERLYRERSAKANCEVGKAELRILEALPRDQWRDHPITVRHENCERSIMLGQ